MQTSEGKKGKKTNGNKAHLLSTLVSHTGKHFSWWLEPRIVNCKKSEAFGSSSYFLNILSELSILLASCSPNTLCCPYIYQSLISVLFTTPCSAVWPSWIQWQSFHIQVMPLQHLTPGMQWIKLINKTDLSSLHLSVCPYTGGTPEF